MIRKVLGLEFSPAAFIAALIIVGTVALGTLACFGDKPTAEATPPPPVLAAVASYRVQWGYVFVYCDPKRPGVGIYVSVVSSGGGMNVQPAPEYCPTESH